MYVPAPRFCCQSQPLCSTECASPVDVDLTMDLAHCWSQVFFPVFLSWSMCVCVCMSVSRTNKLHCLSHETRSKNWIVISYRLPTFAWSSQCERPKLPSMPLSLTTIMISITTTTILTVLLPFGATLSCHLHFHPFLSCSSCPSSPVSLVFSNCYHSCSRCCRCSGLRASCVCRNKKCTTTRNHRICSQPLNRQW